MTLAITLDIIFSAIVLSAIVGGLYGSIVADRRHRRSTTLRPRA